MDHFLIEQERRKDDPDSTFTDKQLTAILMDAFAAGSETTATTLRWAILLLCKHPTVQQKLQEEIDRVVGRDRNPYLEDQNKYKTIDPCTLERKRFQGLMFLL